jgi:uroporphyrin-III C-methyltransferase/precorrin-2 dehydrogenase/sirohydrochlorin ferrochelatase
VDTNQRQARQPDHVPARIRPLATLPVFMRIGGRCVLLAGGSEAAVWKAELLLAAGASVRCVAADPAPALRQLAADEPRLELRPRAWEPADFADAALAICDAADVAEAQRFRDEARRRGIPANLVDRPDFCDFQFGTIVNRSPLVIGISTDGAVPVFGQALRTRIEALLPEGFAAWAEAARRWRQGLRDRALPFRARRQFWEAFTARALAEPNRLPSETDREALLASLDATPAQGKGKVILVGAGPGDPELLTLRAVRALQSADVVLFDDLVSPGILDMARREAERINVGKRGYKPSCGQDEISALLVSLAQAGKVVARLKGGDPLIFGRANEEIEALDQAGIRVEIVPGVTAASGAAAAIGTSLTERDLARRLQFVTAHARDGRLPDDLDWSALADPRATTAIYMGVRTLPALVEKLRLSGLDDSTPVVVVDRATRDDQQIVPSTLANIVDDMAARSVVGPSLILIGAALDKAAQKIADVSAAGHTTNNG